MAIESFNFKERLVNISHGFDTYNLNFPMMRFIIIFNYHEIPGDANETAEVRPVVTVLVRLSAGKDVTCI